MKNTTLANCIPEPSDLIEPKAALTEYFYYCNTLCLIRQLLPLLISLQRHRGASMAFLEGGASFEQKVTKYEAEIKHRFLRIKQLNKSFGHPIPSDQWQSIENEYDALMSHWREDNAMANFEFHSHFIEIINKLFLQLSTPVVDYTLKCSPADSWRTHQLLADFTFNIAPQLIEAMAMVRGLVTYAAVAGHIDPHLHARVKYLLQSVNQHKENLRTILGEVHKSILSPSPHFLDSTLHEHKITQFHQLITDEFLIKKSIDSESHLIFDFITDVIDAYSSSIALGINLLQLNVDDAFSQPCS